MSVTGWTTFKNGKPMALVAISKRDLLIGYDLLPLRGLDKTEQVLTEKGMLPTKVKVEVACEDFDYYAFTLRGELIPEALGYSVLKTSELKARRSWASFFTSCMKSAQKYTNEFNETEKEVLRKYENWVLYNFYKDGRRKTTWAKLQQQVKEFLVNHSIEIVKVKITPLLIQEKENE